MKIYFLVVGFVLITSSFSIGKGSSKNNKDVNSCENIMGKRGPLTPPIKPLSDEKPIAEDSGPQEFVTLDETKTADEALQLRKSLGDQVIGQDRALDEIVNRLQMNMAGYNRPGRPVGIFLLLGPTGTGKTKTVEALANAYLGNERAVVKIDCAEFQERQEIAKLIGAPPGYLGHRETHPLLSQDVLDQFHTDKVHLPFVLFDEIEKANDALWKLMLGITDKGTLTLGDNRKVDFSRSIIFMTSNLGERGAEDLIAKKVKELGGIGFAPHTSAEKKPKQDLDPRIVAARRTFSPEFMNRIDKVIVYNALTHEDLLKITALEVAKLQERINMAGDKYFLRVSDGAMEALVGFGDATDANGRGKLRAIDQIIPPLANLKMTGQIGPGDLVRVDYDQSRNKFVFLKGVRN